MDDAAGQTRTLPFDRVPAERAQPVPGSHSILPDSEGLSTPGTLQPCRAGHVPVQKVTVKQRRIPQPVRRCFG